MKPNTVAKMVKGSTTLIEGLAIPFGGPFIGKDGQGRDLHGEFFSPQTELCLDWFKERPLLFGHGLDKVTGTAVVGKVTGWEIKADMGVWMQAQLDASSDYFDAIRDMVDKGRLFLSSGSVSHLVETTKEGEILRWPWVEESLTPTPANLFATVEAKDAGAHFKAAGLESAWESVAAVKALPAGPTPMTGEDGDPPEGSYEDLIADLCRLIRVQFMVDPWSDSWCYIVATFPAYCIAGVYDGDDMDYYQIGYVLGADGEPVLGEVQQVEPMYVPIQLEVEPSAEAPMALMAAHLIRSATALAARTKDVQQRRVKEGRVLSAANRKRLQAAQDAMATLMQDFEDLLTASEPKPAATAEAKAAIDVQAACLHLLAISAELGVPA